jgi:hypothetical protein
MTWNVETASGNGHSTFVNASKRTGINGVRKKEATRAGGGREALNESAVNVLATSLQCLLLVSPLEGNVRTLVRCGWLIV